SIPGGVVAGVATFVTYLIARHYYTGTGSLDAETSAATLTLFLISMWVLAIIARPYTWWRVALVASMGVAFVFVLVVPALQSFFALKLVGVVMPWTAVGVAVVASAVLELSWKWVERRFPD
ncbi:cation-translocating P-type ATPase, partial [Streptomyces sp. NPDC005921]